MDEVGVFLVGVVNDVWCGVVGCHGLGSFLSKLVYQIFVLLQLDEKLNTQKSNASLKVFSSPKASSSMPYRLAPFVSGRREMPQPFEPSSTHLQ